ncbi:MmcQ/YjbR family DNA-binding protein ['Paenibacillus yunnanensis' Narsing Rao et al. 2020]|uniref:MmcQ/YjbR family DNA-binding protein n=1 Tax=Paenibacillus tengchongensis TaxID=2608684 RepID=UPI00124DE84F|nr:MmcQ/YjbR family DNA-binding protein [Paenibacillus tengchongensis]
MTYEEIVEFCLSFPSTYEDHPFGIEYTAMRHTGNKKLFALIYVRNGHLCVNLKCEPERADFWRGLFAEVKPGYHMNKAHWNTVLLDGELPRDTIQEMVQVSYELTRPKLKRKKKSQTEVNDTPL